MGYKIRTPDPGVSRLAQEIAFERGYEWAMHGKQIRHTNSAYLAFRTTRGRKKILMGTRIESFYNRDGATIVDLGELYKALKKDNS